MTDLDRLCAVIVTYYPDAAFRSFLESIREQFERVVIVDNGSHQPALEMLRELAQDHVVLYEMGCNTGLGVALNRGVREAQKYGYRWAVLFDQDTQPLARMARHFAGIMSSHPAPGRVAVIGSRFIDRNKQSTDVPTSPPDRDDYGWVEKRRVITSGSLLSLEAYAAIGPFREDLFIDSIDHEYCYRAWQKNWCVLQTSTTLVAHSVGNYRRHRLFGRELWRSHHSAARCYFMTRNKALLARERREYWNLLRGGLDTIRNACLILMLEEDKLAKIRGIFSGYVAGLLRDTAIPDWIRNRIG